MSFRYKLHEICMYFLQYIALATQIFQFMNQHLIGSRSSYVREYVVNGLVEQQMMMLAAIIRDLDHETARTEIGTLILLMLARNCIVYSPGGRKRTFSTNVCFRRV